MWPFAFCDDSRNLLTWAVRIRIRCLLQLVQAPFNRQVSSRPARLTSNPQRLHEDCASGLLHCRCCNRPMSRRRDCFFFHWAARTVLLLPEELTACANNPGRHAVPSPMLVIQLRPFRCNVSRKSATCGCDVCCIFRIFGSQLWLRSSGCSEDRLVTRCTRPPSSDPARFHDAVACTGKNLHAQLGMARPL